MNRKSWIVLLIAALVVGVLFYWLVETEDTASPVSRGEDTASPVSRGGDTASPVSRGGDTASPVSRGGDTASPSVPRPRPPRLNAWAAALGTNRLAAAERMLKQQKVEREMTEAEQKLAEFAHDIASASDAKAARKFAGEQLDAEHPKVREAAVFALANCGASCLAELTPYMADADEGVRTEAVSAWRSAWFEMPESTLKAEAAVAVMCVLNDEAALEPIAAELMKFKREAALEALEIALEQGTDAGKASARRVCEALGIQGE